MRFGVMAAAAACVVAAPAAAATRIAVNFVGYDQAEDLPLFSNIVFENTAGDEYQYLKGEVRIGGAVFRLSTAAYYDSATNILEYLGFEQEDSFSHQAIVGGQPLGPVQVNFGSYGFQIDPSSFRSFSVSFVPAGVPEPATWALMILGFGAVGGAMRRKRHHNGPVKAGQFADC